MYCSSYISCNNWIRFKYILEFKNKSKDQNNEQTSEEYDVESNRNLQNEIIALNATYTDAVAWLKIPDTSIDAPVFKGLTNEDYFAKDRDSEEKNMVNFSWITDVI